MENETFTMDYVAFKQIVKGILHINMMERKLDNTGIDAATFMDGDLYTISSYLVEGLLDCFELSIKERNDISNILYNTGSGSVYSKLENKLREKESKTLEDTIKMIYRRCCNGKERD